MDEDEEDMHMSPHPSAVHIKGKGKEKWKAKDEVLQTAIHQCVDQSGQLIKDVQLLDNTLSLSAQPSATMSETVW